MDSLQLYMGICQSAGMEFNQGRLKRIDEIVQCVTDEIMVEPYDLNKSSLIKEIMKLIRIVKTGDTSSGTRISIYPFDAFVIIKALDDKVKDPNFVVSSSLEYLGYARNLFKRMYFQGNQQSEINEINKLLKDVQRVVDEKKEKASTESRRMGDTLGAPYSQFSNRTRMSEITPHVNNELQPCVIQDSSQRRTSMVANNGKSLERSNNCKMNVQRWHDENFSIQKKLSELQPAVSDVLQKIMQFSTEITESYVLQFAKMQIELYNLISDNLAYHTNVVNGSNNKDYYNAVSNYQEFLDMIIDNLSAFGVEEISSRVGSRFDGNCHEVIDNADFSPRLSNVKESVRSGFKYKDIIIQKEKIRV